MFLLKNKRGCLKSLRQPLLSFFYFMILSAYNHFLHYVVNAVTDDDSINTIEDGPQVDNLIELPIHMDILHFVDLYPQV